jgi:hypothetical protein
MVMLEVISINEVSHKERYKTCIDACMLASVFQPQEVLQASICLFSALTDAHALNIGILDLKLENFLVSFDKLNARDDIVLILILYRLMPVVLVG